MAFNSLFRDMEDLRTVYPQIHSSADTKDFFPYLEEAVEKYIYPYIGEDYYQELKLALENTAYNITALTLSQQAVIKPLRRAEAYYAGYTATPFMLMDTSSSGMKEITTDGTSGPRQWVVKDNQRAAIQNADLFMDKVLAVLEKAPTSYTTWAASEAFTIHHELLISNADQFRGINGSRRTFMKMKGYIKMTEDRYIEPAISRQLIDALLAKKKTATAFSAPEQKLINELYDSISYYALFLGAPELRLDISNEGIRMVSTSDGITGITPADRQTYGDWLKRMEGFGLNYLARAKKYLDDNVADFPDYTVEAQGKDEPNIYANNAVSGTGSSVMV